MQHRSFWSVTLERGERYDVCTSVYITRALKVGRSCQFVMDTWKCICDDDRCVQVRRYYWEQGEQWRCKFVSVSQGKSGKKEVLRLKQLKCFNLKECKGKARFSAIHLHPKVCETYLKSSGKVPTFYDLLKSLAMEHTYEK